MARLITGTVSVTANSKNVTTWVGDAGAALTAITAPVGSQIVIDGFANFIEARPTTTTLTLVLPHKGTTGTLKAAAISAYTDEEISIGTLSERTAQVIQDLSVLDANGRGLFYNFITPTGANDPGPGKIAVNSTDPTAVTEIYVDPLDANGPNRDVAGIIQLWSSGTVVILRSIATNSYAAYKLAGPAQSMSSGAFYKLTVAYVEHDGVISAEPLAVEYRLAGLDKDADVYVNSIADRAAYNTQPAGFRVKVADIGDGRAAVYAKRSATSGDWTQPAIVTGAPSTVPGPIGPAPNLSIGTVVNTTGTPSATVTGTNPNYSLNLVLKQGDVGPQGTSFNPDARGLFSTRSTYNSQAAGFAFLATDQGNLYFRQGAAGNWSAAVPLSGPAGASGTTITTTNITGNGTAGPYSLNAAPTGLDSVIEATITGVEQYDYTIGGTAPNYTVTFSQVIPAGVAARVRTAGPLSVGTAAAVASGVVNADAISNDAAQQSAILVKLGADHLAGHRNKFINGDMDIWQRAISQSTSGYRSVDRWNVYGGGTWTFSRGLNAIGAYLNSPKYSGVLNVTSAAPSNDPPVVQQRIEEIRQFNNRKVTIRARMFSAQAVTVSITPIMVYGTGGSAFDTVTAKTQTLTTNSWNEIIQVFDLPSIAGKTISETDSCLQIQFKFPTGSTYIVYMSHFSLTEGDTSGEADPFSPRHISQELALCQRYYEKSYNIGVFPGTATFMGASHIDMAFNTSIATRGGRSQDYKVTKFIPPTITIYSPQNGASGQVWCGWVDVNNPVTLTNMSQSGFQWITTQNTPSNIHLHAQWTAEAEL